MATTTQPIGQGPLWFTAENGSQKSIPLSAFAFSGSAPVLNGDYSGHFSTGDVAMINQLAANLAAAGELTQQPTPPALPAVLFTAAQPGPEGNNITVHVSPPTTDNPLGAQIEIVVQEVDVYAGLADGIAAKAAIGVDTPTAGDRAGTGLVQVVEGSATGGQNAMAASESIAAATSFKAADGKTTLFTLVPRPALLAAKATVIVSVTPDPAPAQTFTVTATYDVPPPTATPPGVPPPPATVTVALNALSTLPDLVTAIVTATTPTELAIPADTSVVLSGGADGIAATGTAYTS